MKAEVIIKGISVNSVKYYQSIKDIQTTRKDRLGHFVQDIGSYFWEKYKDDISFTTVKSSGVINAYWSCCSLQCQPYMGWCQPKGKLWTSWLFSGVLSPLLLLPFIPTPIKARPDQFVLLCRWLHIWKLQQPAVDLCCVVCRTFFKFCQSTADRVSLLSLQHQRNIISESDCWLILY